MQRHSSLLILLFLLLFTTSGTAQPYILQHLSIEDGLSNNYVQDIAQDKRGCIWIATVLGLNRFDGLKFTTYKSTNSKLGNDALNALLYDEEEDELWIGSNSGLYILDCSTEQIRRCTPSEGIAINNVSYLTPASNDGIWIVAHIGQIVHYNKKDEKYTLLSDQIKGELKPSSWCAFDDEDGHLYIGHAQGGLSIIDLENKTIRTLSNIPENPNSLPGNSVYTIYKDHLENIWVGTNQGLGLLNPKTDEFTIFKHESNNPHSLIADHIYDIKEMEDGTLWIASDIGGISILDLHNITFKSPQNVQFYNITATMDKHGLSSGNIRSLLQDKFGNIWIGNYSSGVDFISHTQPIFHVLPYTTQGKDKQKNKPVWGLFQDSEGEIWLGGENEAVVFKDNKQLKSFDITKYLSRPYGQVFSLHEMTPGTFLLGI